MKQSFMHEAVEMAVRNVKSGKGGPFAALVVRGEEVVARGTNLVTSCDDPTAHAEIVAIREACRTLGTFQLDGCDLYTSCEPCPMCMGAVYWARIDRVFYAATRQDAAAVGFDDEFIYEELRRPLDERRITMVQLLREEGQQAFQAWEAFGDRVEY